MKLKLAIIAFGLFMFLSCKKDDTVTTTTPCVIKTSEELLTAKTWKLGNMRVLRNNGTTDYYKRGGASNTFNGDSDSLKFSLNNTGVFIDYLGSTYTTTWNFTNSEKTTMTLVINKPTPLTVFLEDIALADSYFSYGQYATDGIYYLASCRRIPN